MEIHNPNPRKRNKVNLGIMPQYVVRFKKKEAQFFYREFEAKDRDEAVKKSQVIAKEEGGEVSFIIVEKEKE